MRATGAAAAAIRRRRKHQQRIDEHANPLGRLGAVWSWLYAEAKRHPHHLNTVIARMTAIAEDLNADRMRPEEGDTPCP